MTEHAQARTPAPEGDLETFHRERFVHAGVAHDLYRKGRGPAVLLITEMPGITPQVLGLGEATARAFAAAGARVVLVARDASALDALARELDGVSIPADLANAAELARLVPTVVEAVGRVDVLVNNAGAGPAGGLLAA